MMGGIRGKNTKPELSLRKALHARGFRYRLHRKGLPASPDLVFPRYRAVCFIHGCFWHRHPGCRYATTPKTREDFWEAKFAATVERDDRSRTRLLQAGWRVAIVWECSLRGKRLAATVSQVADWLVGESPAFSTDSQSED
jgi:DNA mismatch endonuclease, patch repair protein